MLIIFWSINTCNNYFYFQITSPSLRCSISLLTLTGVCLRADWVSWCMQQLTNLSLLFFPASSIRTVVVLRLWMRKPLWLLMTIGMETWKCCRRSLTSVGRPLMWNPWCQSFRGPLRGSWYKETLCHSSISFLSEKKGWHPQVQQIRDRRNSVWSRTFGRQSW